MKFFVQPYTPSGQTPFMTPYQTPHTQQTPRYGQQTPAQHLPPNTAPHMNGPFLHPGAATPSQRTPSYRNPVQSPVIQNSPHSRSYSGSDHGGRNYHSDCKSLFVKNLFYFFYFTASRAFSSDSPRSYTSSRGLEGHGRGYGSTESTDWQKAAEAWANRTKGGKGKCHLKLFRG